MASHRTCGYVDPGWEHGVAQDSRKKKVRCNYCGKVVSGGVYRLKQHLARLSGEVTYCDKAPEEVFLKMKENLEGCRAGKKSRKVEYDEQPYLNFTANDDVEEDGHFGYRDKCKQPLSDRAPGMNMTQLRSLGYVDPGWEYGVPQDDRKKKVKCNYCEKVVSGGINRFKQHLARIPGEVAPCKNAPEEVYLKMKDNMKWHRTGKRHRKPCSKELSTFYLNSENEEVEELEEENSHSADLVSIGDRISDREFRRSFKGFSACNGSEPLPKRSRSDAISQKASKIQIQASGRQANASSSKKFRREVLSAICKFFYHAGVPSHAANSPYFHRMLELVGQYGPNFALPSGHLLSGRLLQDEIFTIKNYLEDYKSSWAVTGCSILVNNWQDIRGSMLINILVSCPRGVYFFCSVDATGLIDDVTYLYKLLDKVVEEMGEENVVQVITQNTSGYRTAGKMLEEKRKNLFWTPCASYCIDQMLEDFMKLTRVNECMEKGQKITKFIYNRTWLFNLMKKEYTGGAELLRPSFTRCASSFSTLFSLFDHRVGLKRMFRSTEWNLSRFSILDEGNKVKNIVLDSLFWKKVQFVRKSVFPILEVLQEINSNENLSMPLIYNDMCRAKLAIKMNHNDDACKYEPFWRVIDDKWSSQFHHPLYLAAYFLNPSYRYRADFILHPDVIRGLNACIVRLEPDTSRRISTSMQISEFGSAKADFGTDLAISTRCELDPAAWWQQHGINCLELQQIAVRVLSQTCSSFVNEHKWSTHDQLYEQRQNHLAQKRLSDAVYVHYNLRLRERQIRKNSSNLISVDSVLLEHLLYDWLVDSGNQALQEDEEIGIDLGDSFDNDLLEFDDGHPNLRKGSLEIVKHADVIEPVNVIPSCIGGSDDDQDLTFIDDDTTD